MPKKKYETEGSVTNRNTMNTFLFLSSTSVLIITISLVQISSGQILPTWINAENRNDENDYEEYLPSDNYTNIPAFNSASMRIIYGITNNMINSLIPDILPTDLLIINNNGVHIKDDDYLAVVGYYMGYIIFISVFLLFSILMPIIGFCFCCCRCCGNCGADVEPFDKKRDHWRKVVLGSMLLTLAIFFLFGMIGAFGSNEQLQEGTDNLVENLKASISDINLYFSDVSDHVDHLANINLLTFSTTLMGTVGNTSDMLYTQLEEMTNVNIIYDAVKLSEKVEPIKEELQNLKDETTKIRIQTLQLNDATTYIKTRLAELCKDAVLQCDDITNSLVTGNIDLNKVPDLETVIQKIGTIDGDIIQQGKDSLDRVREDMKTEIDDNLKQAQQTIDKTTKEVIAESGKFIGLIKDMNNDITEISIDGMDIAKKFIDEYGIYRYSLGLVVSFIFLLIAMSIFIGIVIGVCADRPDPNVGTCFNKSIGNGFLMLGVVVMFLTSTILVIVLIVHNLAMILQLLVCDPIRNPSTSSVIKFLDNGDKLEELMWPGVTFKSVITNCYHNNSVYEVFNIQEKFDVNDLRNLDLNTDEFIEQIKQELVASGILSHLSTKLNVDALITQLHNLKETGLEGINFEKFEIPNLDEINLESISEQLNDIIEFIPVPTLADKFRSIKCRIDAYAKDLLNPMRNNAFNVKKSVEKILEIINSEDEFNGVINDLIGNLTEMENHVELDPDQIMTIVESVFDIILKQTNTFINYTIDNVETKLGKCAPLASSVNGILSATCDNILLPMNGFWFSIFWCLIFYVPMIIISIKLGSLFKKIEPTSDKFYEPAFFIDQIHMLYKAKISIFPVNMKEICFYLLNFKENTLEMLKT